MADARDAGLLAGRVGRAHGLDGSFYVTRARPALLREGAEVTLSGSGERLAIVRRAGTDSHPILRLAGMTRREEAEALRGQELRLEAASAPQLGPDEYWEEQLAGCRVRSGAIEVGVVVSMLTLPSCECLEVERADGGGPALLVPLVRDAIRSIDVEGRVIEVDLEFLGEEPPAAGEGS